jgi:4-amino-4-deoxychorismate lyase
MLVNGKHGDLISTRDRGLLYGDGVFRTLRTSGGQALQWPLHYQKLQNDCALLGISCPDFSLLSAELGELLKIHPNSVMKLIVTRGTGNRGYAPSPLVEVTRIWEASRLPEYPADWAKKGIRTRWCQLRLAQQPRLAGIKHLNRLENVLAAGEWEDKDIAEGLLMDASGNVIEGTRSNLFLVKHGKLVTPDLSRCGVAGVQRDRVIEWAKRQHMPVQVRDVSQDDILQADELFLVNSIMALWPIRELGTKHWSAFPISAEIQQSLEGAAG